MRKVFVSIAAAALLGVVSAEHKHSADHYQTHPQRKAPTNTKIYQNNDVYIIDHRPNQKTHTSFGIDSLFECDNQTDCNTHVKGSTCRRPKNV
jgi:hypothetical protein